MRLDLRNTLGPELDLQHAAFKGYALHKVYEFVESISREGNFVEFWQSTQKMRMDLRNTLDPELDLQHAAFKSYALHKVYELVESITRELNFVEFWQFTQKMRLDLRKRSTWNWTSSTPSLRFMPSTRYTSL